MAAGIDLGVVEGLVGRALRAAIRQPLSASTKGALHAARSRTFVACLGDELGALYADEPDVRSFSKHNEDNRAELGTNELLFDVTVCRTATVPSASGRKVLRYVREPLWHVESELARDSQQALYDFNKLVLGAAPQNLFVGPLVSDPDAYVDVLRPPAERCMGRVFVALIPHPAEWGASDGSVRCEEL
jgi:hypothetical protein